MATAYHMVHYRRFVPVTGNLGKATLESLCRSALGTIANGLPLWQRPQDRLYSAPSDEKKVLLNSAADLSSAVIGEMCLLQDNDLQAMLKQKISKVQLSKLTNAQIYNLSESTAPKGAQFVRGMLYWLAIKDHIFFVKTHGMTSDLLQKYLDWMLANQMASIGSGITFQLQAEFDKSQVSADIGDIKSVKVSGKSTPHLTITPSQNNPVAPAFRKVARTIADKFVQFGEAVPIVEAILGKTRAQSLVESLGKGEYLSVDASVKIRGTRTDASRAEMKAIANDLADLTDGEVKVAGKDGNLNDGDAILRTRMPFDLPHEGSNLLEFDNVADQLQEVYQRFVKDGKIQA